MENNEISFHNQWAGLTGCLVAGEWIETNKKFVVLDKFTGETVAEVSSADQQLVNTAVEKAKAASQNITIPPHDRGQILRKAALLLQQKRKEFVETMIIEAGFVRPDAEGEVDRAIITLNLTAEETTRLVGDVVPFQASPGAHNRLGITMRFPLGVVCAITPFNSPLNTVLHKVAPAFGAGNAVILKPSNYTPLTAALLANLLLEAGMPNDYLHVLQGDGETVGTMLLLNPHIDFYTFTGSTRVGKIIQQAAGLRRTQMELGSIASTIVCADADLDKALPKIANASFRKAGQVCTSVQRLYVEESIFDLVTEKIVSLAKQLSAGNPRDIESSVGPVITEESATRVEQWIKDACTNGANLLTGGTRNKSIITPAVLTNVPSKTNLWCAEAFAPVLSICPFSNFDDALRDANSTDFGLAAGVFTQNIDRALKAAKTLRFGTIQINETSSARSDIMPFGGVKDSGFGKEGPWHAMREMTEERLLVFNP